MAIAAENPQKQPHRCSDSGFQGVNLAITAGKPSRTAPPLQRFRILGGQFGNRCRECPELALLRAVILDFRVSIWQSLQENPLEQPHRCSDSGFQGVNLGITASFSQETAQRLQRFLISGPDLRIDVSFSLFSPSFVHRFLISRPDLRIDAAQSSWRGRMARLLRP